MSHDDDPLTDAIRRAVEIRRELPRRDRGHELPVKTATALLAARGEVAHLDVPDVVSDVDGVPSGVAVRPLAGFFWTSPAALGIEQSPKGDEE